MNIPTKYLCILMILGGLLLTACGAAPDSGKIQSAVPEKNPQTTVAEEDAVQETDTSPETETTKAVEEPAAVPLEQEIDLSDAFDSINGCAVFYSPSDNTISYYRREMSEIRVSPCSTFKIISTLMGLEAGVLKDENTKMGYDGTKYRREEWNGDLTLSDAFRTSCIWYFRKVIDTIGKEEVSRQLSSLSYGNCDASEWEGSGLNYLPELNGFWVDSSLLISPAEQVRILADILEGNSIYSPEKIAILEDLMFYEEKNGVRIYGKTGSGFHSNAWYAGFVEKEGKREYFAVYLEDPAQDSIIGSDAREVLVKIVAECENGTIFNVK